MKTILLLASLVVFSVAQFCISPPLWQAKIFEADPSKQFGRRADIFYDQQNQRLALLDDVYYEGRENYTFDLLFFGQSKFYSVNLVTKVCTIGALREPFPVIGLPPGSNATGEFYIGVSGLPDNYVLIDRYEDFDGRYVGMWTRLGCAPVATFINSTRYGNVFYEFFDFQLGIFDPNVFAIPQECL
ncbi:hypothetical protein EMCRGX_G032424 [Ephydatia muelleri]